MGHNVTVLCSYQDEKEEIIDGMQIIRIKTSFKISRTPISIRLLNSMRKLISKNDFDIINVNLSVPFFPEIAALMSKLYKIPCVLTYHNDIIKEEPFMKFITTIYNITLNKLLLNSVDLIITSSPFCYNESKFLKPFKDKLTLIPPGVDIEKYSSYKSSNIKSKYNIPHDSKIVLFAGVMSKSHAHKGLKYLIKSFKNVLNEINDSYLVLVGDGDMVSEYKELGKKIGISANVIFTGFILEDELIDYYRCADIVVLPSTTIQEGFGMVLIEGNACKKPVIGTKIGGIQYVIKDGETGLLVPPKDSKALANSIIKLLKDKKTAEKMGINGRKLVEDKYNWDHLSEMTEKVYKELI